MIIFKMGLLQGMTPAPLGAFFFFNLTKYLQHAFGPSLSLTPEEDAVPSSSKNIKSSKHRYKSIGFRL